jgi:hypothetical protein
MNNEQQVFNNLTNKKILSLTKKELERECKKKGLPIDGNKDDLQLRLLQFNDQLASSKPNPAPTKKFLVDFAEEFVCPITIELPWNPVTAGDGKIYERSAIELYIKTCLDNGRPVTSPATRQPMSTLLLPAPHVRNVIEKWIESGIVKGDITNIWKEKMKEKKNADELLSKAKGGDAVAMYNVGIEYLYGNSGFEQDKGLSHLWFEKAHKAGDPKGTAMLGFNLCNGNGVNRSTQDGIMYLTLAGIAGSEVAAFYLGKGLAKGFYGLSVNKPEAIEWLKKCLDKNCRHKHLCHDSKEDAQKLLDELTAEGDSQEMSDDV